MRPRQDTMTARPEPSEYAPFYADYVALVPEGDILGALERQIAEFTSVAAAIPPEKETYRYEPSRWSVRQVFGHIGDAERVFAYRAFCIGRGEQAGLPAFDENSYVAEADHDSRGVHELVADFALVRQAALGAFRRLSAEGWRRRGTANESPVSVRGLAHIMVGHPRHHLAVLRGRYGLSGI
jgi:hypothetical protein